MAHWWELILDWLCNRLALTSLDYVVLLFNDSESSLWILYHYGMLCQITDYNEKIALYLGLSQKKPKNNLYKTCIIISIIVVVVVTIVLLFIFFVN